MDSKTLCLGALMLGDASGYEIKKTFEDGPFSFFHQTSFGSIYPSLGKLTEQGHVTCDEHEQDGRPDKKVYSLTDSGRAAFIKALTVKPKHDRIRSESMYMLFFAQLLDSGHVHKVFEGYLQGLRHNIETLSNLNDDGISPSRLFVRGFGKAFYEAGIKYMEENRHMVLNDDAVSAGEKS